MNIAKTCLSCIIKWEMVETIQIWQNRLNINANLLIYLKLSIWRENYFVQFARCVCNMRWKVFLSYLVILIFFKFIFKGICFVLLVVAAAAEDFPGSERSDLPPFWLSCSWQEQKIEGIYFGSERIWRLFFLNLLLVIIDWLYWQFVETLFNCFVLKMISFTTFTAA